MVRWRRRLQFKSSSLRPLSERRGELADAGRVVVIAQCGGHLDQHGVGHGATVGQCFHWSSARQRRPASRATPSRSLNWSNIRRVESMRRWSSMTLWSSLTRRDVASQQVTEASSQRLVGRRERVGVDAQCHRGVGVTESTGDRSHVVALADRDGGRPVAQIVETPLHVDARVVPRSSPPPADVIGRDEVATPTRPRGRTPPLRRSRRGRRRATSLPLAASCSSSVGPAPPRSGSPIPNEPPG